MTIRSPASLIAELLKRPVEPWQRAALRSMQKLISGGGSLSPEQLQRLQRIADSIEGTGNE